MSIFTRFGETIWTKWPIKNHEIVDISKPEVTSSSRSIYSSKTNIIVGNLPLFNWRIFHKNSLIEFAPQRCFVLLFSVCVVGDSFYPEVTRYTLKWWSKKIPSNCRFIEYRLNLSHISVHSHSLLPFHTKQSIKTFFYFF